MEGRPSKSSAAPPTLPTSPAAAARGLEQLEPINEEALRNLVIQRDWSAVEKELKQILPEKEQGKDHAELHPDLFLPVYQEWIEDLIRKNDGGAAFKVFADKVMKIYYVEGEFVADQEGLKSQVSRLHKIANEIVELLSPPTETEKICVTLLDYLDLYFPERTRHIEACEGYHHLWRFAKRLDKPKGQKDPNFKCLACGMEFKNCTISNEEEAKKKIYSVCTTTYTGFGALISEELSHKVKGLPGVLWVLPDSYLDVPNKDYGGDLFVDGKVIHRPQFRFTERQQVRSRPRPRYDRRRETVQVERRETMQRGPSTQQQRPPFPQEAAQNLQQRYETMPPGVGK